MATVPGAPTYPDADQVLVAALQAEFAAARVCTELPADVEQHLPVIQCNRFGGNVRAVGLDNPWIDVDVWHSSDDAAALLAAQVRSWLLLGAAGKRVVTSTGVGVIARVHEQTGAMRRPTGNPDLWRRGMAFTITIHAAP